MYCTKCGAAMADGARFCAACGSAVNTAEPVTPDAAAKTRPAGKKKLPSPAVLVLAVLVLLGAFRLFQFRGYKAFTEDYFAAMESGDEDAVMALYSWDYVQENNQRIIERYTGNPVVPDPAIFTSETLERYVYNHDKYYRFCFGKQLADWEVTDVSKNVLSFRAPEMKVEVRVVYGGGAPDLTVRLEMERGGDGWYMTDCDAGYTADETEGQE